MSCEIGQRLKQSLRNAISARDLAEVRLETNGRDARSFESRWDEFVVAKEAWASRVFARQIHMRSCAQCKANPLRGAKTEPTLGARLTGLG
jgi:hypothetical protein